MLRLAALNLLRHRARNTLTAIGIAVATAILFDMVLLGDGIVHSFRELLVSLGYELRVTPRGTLPFSSDATFADARELRARLLADSAVDRVGTMLGETVYARRVRAGTGTEVASFAIGVDRGARDAYRLLLGSGLTAAESGEGHRGGEVILNGTLATALACAPGDTIVLGPARDAATGVVSGTRAFVVRGVADFYFDARGQRTLALDLADLQDLEGRRARDEASLFLVSLVAGHDAGSTAWRLGETLPAVDVYSVEELVRSVRARLSYFQQFSRILGSISLVVNFLLIGTIVGISVNERLGELALLRAIGFRRARVVTLVLAEAMLLALVAGGAGIALGLVLARYLDSILKASPGLPEAVSFFVVTDAGLARTLGFILSVGVGAGGVAAAIAARRPIADTLRREAL